MALPDGCLALMGSASFLGGKVKQIILKQGVSGGQQGFPAQLWGARP